MSRDNPPPFKGMPGPEADDATTRKCMYVDELRIRQMITGSFDSAFIA
jgi:hypothetical protein